jgi:hypothetical protein
MNPLIESISTGSNISPHLAARLAGEDSFRKQTLDQKAIPTEKEEHLLDPWFFKCDDKIVKYDMRELGRWKVSYKKQHLLGTCGNITKTLCLGHCKLLVHCVVRLGHLEPSYLLDYRVLLYDVCGDHLRQH